MGVCVPHILVSPSFVRHIKAHIHTHTHTHTS
ncbi:hypothetical protein, conserved [Leishmania donovani]|uniref:Uncharacterized protein n=1 Tax=Leishmania donovani TaxID=5661 RepID=E9BFG4_LEIDO|nr:hypothetical protein, conserved [Leishmania donovani]CBZ33990.1 hypothetical protein, conserved [Leishmania donovani]